MSSPMQSATPASEASMPAARGTNLTKVYGQGDAGIPGWGVGVADCIGELIS